MDGAAIAVAEHLDLDMTRTRKIFLEVDGIVAERGLGLGAGGRECEGELFGRVRYFHAAPASAGGSLDQQRKADRACERQRLLVRCDGTVRARQQRDAKPPRRALGFDLVAHQADMGGLRADEMDIVLLEDFGESRVL